MLRLRQTLVADTALQYVAQIFNKTSSEYNTALGFEWIATLHLRP
jgi:hypothetical protein